MNQVKIKTPTIRLDQFLKWANLTGSGGESKYVITEGLVKVNGEQELRRGKTLSQGDQVEFNGGHYQVVIEE